MYSFVSTGSWSADELWARYAAAQALDDAISCLEQAGAALSPLVAQSDWRSRGVRALHDLLDELVTRTSAEITGLRTRAWELEAVG